MRNRIEISFQVRVIHRLIPGPYMTAYLLQRLMRRTPRSEPVRTIQEVCLKNRLQDQQGRHLHYPVTHRRYPQRPQLSIRLRDVHAFYRLRLVGLLAQRILNPFQESRHPLVRLHNLLDRDPVHPGRALVGSHPLPACFQTIHPKDPVVQHVKPELWFLLGLLAQLLSQLRNLLRQSRLLHRFRHRPSCGCPSFRSGIFIQAVFSSPYRFMLSARPLRSAGVTPLPRYYGPLRRPAKPRAGYVFPPRVGPFCSHPTGPPRLLGCSFHARCPQPPRKVRWLPMPVASPAASGFISVGRLATFVFLSRPNRVHLRYGSRVRLPIPPAPLLRLTLVRLHVE